MSKFAQRTTVSIVSASFSNSVVLKEHLESVFNSSANPNEVIVATSLSSIETKPLRSCYPEVTWLEASSCNVFELRALGVKEAKSEAVILTEDHCIWAPGSLQAFLEAHQTRAVNLTGSIDNGRTDSAFGWALYCVEYAKYAKENLSLDKCPLCAANALYTRASLERIRSVWESGFYDNEVHDALASEESWAAVPDAQVFSKLGFSVSEAIGHMRDGGRRFGEYRRARLTPISRILFMFGGFLIPLVMLSRLLKAAVVRERHRKDVLLAIPYIILLYTAWAWGELESYWSRYPKA